MEKKKDHVYFIRIGDPSENLYKIGTTNNLKRRMREHEKNYQKHIEVLWVSPAYSKWTTLKVETAMIEQWRQAEGFEYIRNDRFIIDPAIRSVSIKVRKNWIVDFESTTRLGLDVIRLIYRLTRSRECGIIYLQKGRRLKT